VIHAVDERGDGISDYFIEVGTVGSRGFAPLAAFDLDVHAYKNDRIFRCSTSISTSCRTNWAAWRFASSRNRAPSWWRTTASTRAMAPWRGPARRGKWDAVLELDADLGRDDIRFFFPRTTTLVEVKLNREPMPLGGVNRVFWFKPDEA
jgi:hypothetical protein